MLTLRGAMPREAAARQPLCADIDGFSLHAAVRVVARDRKRLEQLCRYITRPALSDERVHLNAAGRVVFRLKTPWREGATDLLVSHLEFMQRLGLVPRPRLNSWATGSGRSISPLRCPVWAGCWPWLRAGGRQVHRSELTLTATRSASPHELPSLARASAGVPLDGTCMKDHNAE